MGRSKLHNEYENAARVACGEETPKAVFAALAWAMAMRLAGDDEKLAGELLRDEWLTLHINGIVQQEPR
jgi:hypothetical protein